MKYTADQPVFLMLFFDTTPINCDVWGDLGKQGDTADQPVFLNESDKDDCVVLRGYGRAPSGRDTVHHISFNREVRYSILPALLLSGYMTVRVID